MAVGQQDTQVAVDVAIDEVGRTARGSVQWLVEKDDRAPVTEGNDLRFFVCGQEGFRAIYQDLWNAKESVDIVCWGFDPGMELLREHENPKKWPRGHTYGSLLEALSNRKPNPVKVRLLIWYNAVASRKQNNMPGWTDAPQGSGYASEERHRYCVEWWERHLPRAYGTARGGENPNLQIALRDIPLDAARSALADEGDAAVTTEQVLLKGFATHHQKPILIDYAYDGGSKAVGYVMGLNSLTAYWDTCGHPVDDAIRERWKAGGDSLEVKFEQETQGQASQARYNHAKPYQDYACRIEGPALKRLHENFVRGWNAARHAPKATEMAALPPRIKRLPRNPAHRVQIVRTQPEEREKTIKALYFQAVRYARNYIYIENQYFMYPAFARHLKNDREKFCDAWERVSNRPIADIPKLHLFLVIPHPEEMGLVPRTFDSLTELGKSDAMTEQGDLVDAGRLDQPYAHARTGEKGNKVIDRPSLKVLEDSLGLKVSVARLRASGLDANHRMAYREIYIHSKLMLIDDVFVTLGSANLNQRSMCVDSEINISATGEAWASGLRKRVFELNSGALIAGTGARNEVPVVFSDWEALMDKNRLKMKFGESMEGFLLPFEDHRSTTWMFASVAVPSSLSA